MKNSKLSLAILTVSTAFLISSNIALAEGDAGAGKTKFAQCSFCHGQDGKGMGTNPKLAGIDKALFAKHIAAFKSGERKNPMMESMAKKLSDQDVEDLAAYLSSL